MTRTSAEFTAAVRASNETFNRWHNDRDDDYMRGRVRRSALPRVPDYWERALRKTRVLADGYEFLCTTPLNVTYVCTLKVTAVVRWRFSMIGGWGEEHEKRIAGKEVPPPAMQWFREEAKKLRLL